MEAPPTADPAYTADLIQKRSQQRHYIQGLERASQRAHESSPDDVATQLQRVQDELDHIQGRSQEEQPQPSSWRPVNLGAILDGSQQPPQPTVGVRDDGKVCSTQAKGTPSSEKPSQAKGG